MASFTRHTQISIAAILVGLFGLTALAEVPKPEFDTPTEAPLGGLPLPTGMKITPEAMPGAVFTTLNPNLDALPDFLAGQAASLALSPDGRTLLVLTSGYYRNYGFDAALRADLTIRNYGFYGDLTRYSSDHPNAIPPVQDPHAENLQVFFPTKASLAPHSDPNFRGYDMSFPDFWRFKEWEREFDEFVAAGDLPNLTLLRLPHDHFGNFGDAIDGVNTVETQMADNDYAVGLVVEKVAASPFAGSTLIFVIEDDAQNGGDHVDAHRSIGLVAGAYVRQGAVISKRFTTVSMLRTIEEALGLPPLGINDGLAEPMAELFDLDQADWSYSAKVPDVLRTTDLPLPASDGESGGVKKTDAGDCFETPVRTAAYWESAMQGQNFVEEDRLDTAQFNEALWRGMKGEDAPLPGRSGIDLSEGRSGMIAQFRQQNGC